MMLALKIAGSLVCIYLALGVAALLLTAFQLWRMPADLRKAILHDDPEDRVRRQWALEIVRRSPRTFR